MVGAAVWHPNFAAHGGFCSVNMAAGGIYTIGGAFWEFGSPDWDLTEMFVLFGVAEDHDSIRSKLGLANSKGRGKRVVSVNPVQTGYAAISDDWYGVTPGTDGLLIISLIRELMRSGNIDVDYLRRYTNAPWLVIRNPGAANDGLFLRDKRVSHRFLTVQRESLSLTKQQMLALGCRAR